MSINVPGVPDSRRTPGVVISVSLGARGGGGAARLRGLILGNRLSGAIIGATPAMSFAGGTYSGNAPVRVFGEDDALTLFGSGSELHLMARAFFDAFPGGELWALPVAEGMGATAGTATLTLGGTATASGTLRLYVNGERIDVGFTSGAVGTAAPGSACLALDVCNAINLRFPWLPVSAQYDPATGIVTLTAKNKGPRSSNIDLRVAFVTSPTTESALAATVPTSVSGISATASHIGRMPAGTTADSIADALDAIEATQFDRIALAQCDVTNIALLRDHLASLAGPSSMLWQQGIVASHSDADALVTLNAGINGALVQFVGATDVPMTTGEIAAQVMGARLYGDTPAGGDTEGEATNPAANLNGLALRSVPAPASSASWLSATEVETLLNYGVTPLVPDPARPGFMRVVASITSRFKDSNGAFNFAVWKTKVVTVSHYIAADLRARLQSTYRGFTLRADTADGTPPDVARVTEPKLVRAQILAWLIEYQARGLITDVDSLANSLRVEINASNRARLDCSIPELPIPDLDIIAAELAQLA